MLYEPLTLRLKRKCVAYFHVGDPDRSPLICSPVRPKKTLNVMSSPFLNDMHTDYEVLKCW